MNLSLDPSPWPPTRPQCHEIVVFSWNTKDRKRPVSDDAGRRLGPSEPWAVTAPEPPRPSRLCVQTTAPMVSVVVVIVVIVVILDFEHLSSAGVDLDLLDRAVLGSNAYLDFSILALES